MTVRYQGTEYAVIGVYFRPHLDRHEIHYILRPTLSGGEGLATAQPDASGQPRLPLSSRSVLSWDLRGMR